MVRGTPLFAFLLALVACSESGGAVPSVPEDGGADAPTAETCAPPSYRGATDATCVTGGYAKCFEGSKPRASGWGCEAIVAEKACTGATREAIGETGCVPVGDCNATFPPSGATHFVSPGATVDATHFQTIIAAVAAAPAGAVIAIDTGEYADSLLLTKDLTLVGRCPEKVIIGGLGPGRVQAIRTENAKTSVRGVTVTKSLVGVSLGTGASVTLSDSVVDGAGLTGISLSDGASSIDLSRVVVRATRPGGDGRGPGLNAQAGSTVVAKDCAFAGNTTQNVRISTNSSATFERVVIRDGKPSSAFDFGRGIQIVDGAKVTLTRAAFLDNYDIGIVAGPGTIVDLHDVVVARTKLAASGEFGRAINAFDGAILTGDGVHVHDNHDASIMVSEPGTKVTLTRSSVVDTAFDRDGYVGRGLTAQNGASLVFEDSAVVASREVGVAVFTAGTQVLLRRSVVTVTTPNAGDYFGHGVLATNGGSIAIEDSEISASTGTGIAIGVGSARLSRVRIRANTVGLYVQDGTTLREVAEATASPGMNEVTVSADSVFAGNGTRVSAGQVPLPEPSRVLTP